MLNPSTDPDYTGKVNAPDTEFPYGSARDASIENDPAATPLLAKKFNDDWGFDAALLDAVSASPSGTPDTAESSQRLAALRALFDQEFADVPTMIAFSKHAEGLRYSTGGTTWQVTADVTTIALGGGLYARALTDALLSDFIQSGDADADAGMLAAVAYGGKVRLSPGEYTFSSNIVLLAEWRGDQKETVILRFKGTGLALDSDYSMGGFTIVGDYSNASSGKSGVRLKGGVGKDVGPMAIQDFDVNGLDLGVKALGGAYFCDVSEIEILNPNVEGEVGLYVAGLDLPNTNANLFTNVFVKGRWKTFHDIEGNSNAFMTCGVEPDNSSVVGGIVDVFKVSGNGNTYFTTYVEPVGASDPDTIFRFAGAGAGLGAQGNRFVTTYMASVENNVYSRIVDEGTNNNVDISPVGFNFAQSAGANESYINVLSNADFAGVKADGLPVGWVLGFGSTGLVTQDDAVLRGGEFSVKMVVANEAATLASYLYTPNPATRLPLNMVSLDKMLGKTVSAGVWCLSSTPGLGAIKLAAGQTVGGSTHSGSGEWEFLTITYRVDVAATEVAVQLRSDSDNTDRTGECWFSEPVVVVGNTLPSSAMPLPLPDSDARMAGRIAFSQPLTLTVDSTTPDVSGGNTFLVASTVATTISDFEGGVSGQEITLRPTTPNTTVADNANIKTNTGANKVLAVDRAYKFAKYAADWVEV